MRIRFVTLTMTKKKKHVYVRICNAMMKLNLVRQRKIQKGKMSNFANVHKMNAQKKKKVVKSYKMMKEMKRKFVHAMSKKSRMKWKIKSL